jgi:hypothetical protein
VVRSWPEAEPGVVVRRPLEEHSRNTATAQDLDALTDQRAADTSSLNVGPHPERTQDLDLHKTPRCIKQVDGEQRVSHDFVGFVDSDQRQPRPGPKTPSQIVD